MNLNFIKINFLIYTLIVATTGFVTNVSGSIPDWLWAKSSNAVITKMALDRNGNFFVTGNFNDTIVMGADTLRSYGNADIFVAKLDSAGNVLWALQAGGTNYDAGTGIGVDDSGYVYVGGYYSEDIINGLSVSANFSGNIFSTIGVTDLFLVKYDADGNFIWGRQAGGDADDYCEALSVDHLGNCYITGSYGFDVYTQYGGYDATFSFVTLTCNGDEDVFVAKYDRLGNLLWTEQGTGYYNVRSFSIDHDNSGNAYITGNAFDAARFDTTIVGQGPSGVSYYVAKCNALGWSWAKDAPGNNSQYGAVLSTDVSGNSYVLGDFDESIIFDADTFRTSNNLNAFLVKYDSHGSENWACQIYSDSFASGSAIKLINDSSFIFAGRFSDSLIIKGQTLIANSAHEDLFICKMDSSGIVESLLQLGGKGYDLCNDLAILDSENFYIGGSYIDSINVGPFSLSGNGYSGFLARYGLYSTVEIKNLTNKNYATIFPNPMTDLGTVDFVVYEKGLVKADLIDQSGKFIRSICEGIFTPGQNEINFKVNSQPSGIYYLRIQMKDYTIIKKFILMN